MSASSTPRDRLSSVQSSWHTRREGKALIIAHSTGDTSTTTRLPEGQKHASTNGLRRTKHSEQCRVAGSRASTPLGFILRAVKPLSRTRIKVSDPSSGGRPSRDARSSRCRTFLKAGCDREMGREAARIVETGCARCKSAAGTVDLSSLRDTFFCLLVDSFDSEMLL